MCNNTRHNVTCLGKTISSVETSIQRSHSLLVYDCVHPNYPVMINSWTQSQIPTRVVFSESCCTFLGKVYCSQFIPVYPSYVTLTPFRKRHYSVRNKHSTIKNTSSQVNVTDIVLYPK